MKLRIKTLYAFIVAYLHAKRSNSLNRQQIQRYQTRQFQTLKDQVLIHSPFYRDVLARPLEAFPILNKKTYFENFNTINTVGLDRDTALNIAIQSEKTRDFTPKYGPFSVGLSSGTSGSRGLFVVSDEEQASWAGYIIGRLKPTLLKKDRVALFLRANHHLYKEINSLFLEFKFFDLLQGVEPHMEALEKFKPTIIVAPASVLIKITNYQPKIKPNKVMAAAEVLEHADEQRLKDYFQQTIHQIYQCTEGFLASTCSHGSLHLNEDVFIIEKHWIDQDSRRFSPIITDLKRKTHPLVRYLLDDILIENPTACPCGSHLTRLSAIEGRKDDIITLPHVRTQFPVDIFPDFIRNTMITVCPEIEEYQVTQTKNKELHIAIDPISPLIQKKLIQGLQPLWEAFEVEPPRCQFSQYEAQEPHQKLRRIRRA